MIEQITVMLLSAATASVAAWAVISRPDRWAGAATYWGAAREIAQALRARRLASPEALARLRYCSTACLACSSAMLALACAASLLGSASAPLAYMAALLWHMAIGAAFALLQIVGPALSSESARHG